MRDLLDILAAVREFDDRGKPYAVATVVKVAGSTYRRPGARMFLSETDTVGAVSGGCLENDVREHASQVIASGKPKVVRYDTSFENDTVMGLGIGCDGIINVLIERLPALDDAPAYTDFLAHCLAQNDHGVLATVFASDLPDTPIGSRLILRSDGTTTSNIGGATAQAVIADAGQVIDTHQSIVTAYADGRVEVLIEAINPPLPLLVFGAGHDAMPLVALAAALGWHVTVVDPRDALANTARFPGAARIIICHPEQLSEHLTPSSPAVAVVMTHNYEWDRILASTLLASSIGYVGMLGPKKRTTRLLNALEDAAAIPAGRQDILRFPVGLDIGAETPEEVALSIIAEIQAVIRARSAGFLKDREAAIH